MYEQFEKLLKERGLTGRQVAIKAGVGAGTITDWKMGRYTPVDLRILVATRLR